MFNLKRLCLYGSALTGSLSLVMFYIYLKYKAEEFERNSDNPKRIKRRIKVPHESVGTIVGREGSKIKSIRVQTGAKIYVPKEEGEHDRTVIVSGTEEAVNDAVDIIHEVIKEISNIVTKEITVPNKICGKLIGRRGDHIKMMMRTSKAKIDVSQSQNESDPEERIKVVVKGTEEQVNYALGLIKKTETEYINEVATRRARPHYQNSYSRPYNNYNSSPKNYNHVSNNSNRKVMQKPFNNKEEFMEAFMCTTNSPDHFVLQLADQKTSHLGNLIETMTLFYEDEENKSASIIQSEVSIGDLCATQFSDNNWYRVKITDKIINGPSEIELRLFYVDFGDVVTKNITEVFHLLPKFQTLPHQGIICSLDKVRPLKGEWTKEAIEWFDTVTLASKFIPISARINYLKDKVSFVDLVVNQGNCKLYVGPTLIENGFAELKDSVEVEE